MSATLLAPPRSAGPRRRLRAASPLQLELAGAAMAVALAVATVATLAESARSEVLFRDGDSVLLPLITQSMRAGDPQEWTLSAVLFGPELALFAILERLGMGDEGTLATQGVLHFVALYAALRYASGALGDRGAAVLGGVLGMSLACVLAGLERSDLPRGFELVSLLATTTYYASTVLAMLVLVGLAARVLASRRTRYPLLTATAAIVLISAASNPLILAWSVAPLCLVACAAWCFTGRRRRALELVAALIAGAAFGMLARLAFSDLIGAPLERYSQPDQWRDAIEFYGGHLALHAQADAHRISLLIGLATVTVAAILGYVALRDRRVAPSVIIATIAVTMLSSLLGAILLGALGTRYLQAIAWMPVLAAALLPPMLASGPLLARRVPAALALGVALIAAGTTVASTIRLGAAVSAAEREPSAACVAEWMATHDRRGAGQFWTIRPLKLQLEEPSRLLQVDTALDAYDWLANRADFDARDVHFLITDRMTFPLEDEASLPASTPISCGRYTIHDFGGRSIQVGALD